jgi:ankyrin repeat protein
LFLKGSTPLHDAAGQGHREVVELLISAGASLSVEDKEVIKTSVKLRQSNQKFHYLSVALPCCIVKRCRALQKQ